MIRFERLQGVLLAYGTFLAIISLFIIGWMISSPSEPSNAVLFGFSIVRLAIVIGLFFVLLFFMTIIVKSVKDRMWAEHFIEKWFGTTKFGQKLVLFSGVLFGLGWIGCFLPAYRLGILENYLIRAQPLIVFILLTSLTTLLVFFFVRNKFSTRDFYLANLKLGLPLFVSSLLLFGWMFLSGFGVISLEDFWYGAGVPILVSQVLVAIFTSISFMYFEPRWRSKQIDVVICILIYGVTAYLWAREPLQASFLFTAPSAPNHVFYPFADAANFDTASQFPLIGENLRTLNNIFFERPLYLSFLVYLHTLLGQDYELLMAVQAGVFAILPVLVYLIGRSMDVRSIGFGTAIITMFRGINSIQASNMIDMANPKMILTDFPSAIGVALIILFMCIWLKEPERNRHYLVWTGGAIGFTLMLRTNALIILVFVLLYVVIRLRKEWRQWGVGLSMIVLGTVFITLPWEIRNLSIGGQMYAPILGKIQAVIEQRYPPVSQQESSLPKARNFSSLTFKTIQPVSLLYWSDGMMQDDTICNTVICFSSNHFLHNTITSILILPTSPMLDNIKYLVRYRNPYYWKADWDGTFTSIAPFFLVLNLFFIGTGIAFAWKEKRMLGMIPFAIFTVYNVSNSLARTSGGRYIVPIDWIIPFYYLLGIIYVTIWLAKAMGMHLYVFSQNDERVESKRNIANWFSKTLLTCVILFGFGSLIPFSEHLHPVRYTDSSVVEALSLSAPLIYDAGLEENDISEFLQSPNAVILTGRALYPRYYKMDKGVTSFGFYPYIIMKFPRMAFTVAGPSGQYAVVLPGDTFQYFPHSSDVLVLGCVNANYIDALAVIILDENGTIYTRNPVSELQCPLSQPVCNNNSICQ